MLDKDSLIETGLISQRAHSVYDYQFDLLLKDLPWREWYEEKNDPLNCRIEYLETYKTYLKRGRLNTMEGLDQFSQCHLINGTTQTFDEAYYKYKERRLRFYRGEYAYHRRVVQNWRFLEDEPLSADDYVIVSVPHCTTGDVPEEFYSMLDEADACGVPVIVDCAYWGTCYGVTVDLSHPAIESVNFSLTKGTGLGRIRSGVRFSHLEDDLPICQQNRYDHTVLAAAKIGIHMMEKLETPDHIPTKFREHQQSVCSDLGVTPTKCVHLALGDTSWPGFEVDGYYRLGIRNLVKARSQGRV